MASPLLLLQIPNPLRLSFLPTSRSLPPHSSSRFLPRFRLRSPVTSASTSEDSSSLEDSFTKYSGYLFDGEAAAEIAKLDSYDASKIEEIYRRRPFLVLRRLLQIFSVFGRWFSLRYFDRVLGRSEEMFKVRAGQFRMLLVELGPAFVKIAQAVSSRPDITPPSYLDELSLLQDQIAPFSSEIAFQTIEKELGLPIDTIFSEISLQPVAAASIGQVYQARLQLNREIVAVKVQRPGVQAAISLDMYILRFLAAVLRRIAKFNTDLPAVVDEWASSLFREMNYRSEAKNGQRFRELYGSLPDVVVPKMYLELSTRQVLVMEWIEGRRLSEVKDLYLVEVGVYFSLTQLLERGFYHADPHPGNLLCTSDGKLAYLDFGMMGEFREELRDGFIEACLHLVNRDFDALANDFVTLGLLPPSAKKSDVTVALTGVFQSAVSRGVRNISFGDLSGSLGRTMYKFKFQIPSYFSLVIRSLAVLEGIAIGFDPKYKVLSSSYPWIARKVLVDSTPKLRSSLRTLLYKGGTLRVDRLESLVTESLRARTTLVGTVERADARNDIRQLLNFALSEKGEFLREIILQEAVKGIDALGRATLDSVSYSTMSVVPFSSSIRLPSIVDEEDTSHLRTLYRLSLLISKLQENPNTVNGARATNTTDSATETAIEYVSLIIHQIGSFQDAVPVALSIVSELPPREQQLVLRINAELAGRLASRIAARTLRRLIN